MATCLVLWAAALGASDERAEREFFEKKIRPVLVRHCYECHSSAAAEPKGSLLLDSREGLRRGGESGPAVVPGDAAGSLLLEALRHESLEMPPSGKLPGDVIGDFREWIEGGAFDPRDAPPDAQAAELAVWEASFQQRRRWWSLQPRDPPPLAAFARRDWALHPIDHFVLSSLEEHGLEPAPRGDRAALVRRLSVALTGLPPKPSHVDAFLEDDAPNAWQRLVDRLLASPHFGEHWARHWMDVVRYTDTYGYEWDIPAKGAWRYRDYLIRALNADVPIDQLIREQIAGDLVEQPRIDARQQINESLIGVMFYQMGEKRHGDSAMFNGIHQEMLDNKIDALSKAFQGLTVACARCHDHKLDAVSQREYYALAGVFMSSRWVTNTVDLPGRNAAVLEDLKSLKAQLRPLLAAVWREQARSFAADILAASVAPSAGEGGRWGELLQAALDKEPPLEDPLYAWVKLIAAARGGGDLAEAWQQVTSRYRTEAETRARDNATHFKTIADFREAVPDGWSVDGVGLRQIVACGDFTVALEGEAAVGRLLAGGLVSDALSPRLNGVVRTPILNQFRSGQISFEYSGGDFAAHRTIVDNAFLAERQGYLNQKNPAWMSLSTLSPGEHQVYIELATKTSNPNFPPRVGLGGACSEEQAADPRSWFGLSRVVLHDAPFPPRDELARFDQLLAREAPKSLAEVAEKHAGWFASAIDAWDAERATEDDVRLINWLLDNQLLVNRRDVADHPEISRLVTRYRQTEQRVALPWTVNGMADVDSGFDYRLNIRGDYDQLGEAVPRGYLRVLCGDNAALASPGSGRRQLAELVASPDNPLTSRVFVNRVWHWLFGAGIVTTANDFGHLGALPSHPGLLDYLADRFVAEGWSLKRLVRAIVLTETWRQSGRASERARVVDPRNRLLHHYPLRRLSAEAIRDAMLAVSGRHEVRLYGPPVNPYRLNEDPQKRLFCGPLDGDGRRSLYTKVTIMEPSRFLATFNQPDPKIPTGSRDVTSTAAQSLALLNDPFVLDQAQRWAEALVAKREDSVAERLTRMFREALAREPTDRELDRWGKAVAELAAAHQTEEHAVLSSIPVWRDVAHAMFNMKEFIYVR